MSFFQSTISSDDKDFFETQSESNTNFLPAKSQNFESLFDVRSQNIATFLSSDKNTQESQMLLAQNFEYESFSEDDNDFSSFSGKIYKSRQIFEESVILFSDENDSDVERVDNQEDDKMDSELSIVQYSPQNNLEFPKQSQDFYPTHANITQVEIEEDFSAIPERISQMFKDIKEIYSDYTFTSLISGQLCSEMFPFGAYNHLKMPLLMSLVSTVASQENKLHIMAISHDVSHGSKIMNYMGKFAQRFLRITSNFDDITVNNNNVIEGGSISLASNGVAFFGNWQRIPQKSALKLLRTIETKTMLVDKLQKNYPFRTTIWSYWNFTTKIKKDLASISQFINVFGIPIIIDDEVFSEDIIDDLLNQALTEPFSRSNDFQISESDFRLYVNYASNLTVDFDSRADDMLKNYFMATKIIRPDALSEKGYDVLKIMAESHAKLCLRKNVTRQDVLVAISIAEKFIKEFFEKDSFTSPSFSMETASIECYDKFLSDLYQWYLKFTKDVLEKL